MIASTPRLTHSSTSSGSSTVHTCTRWPGAVQPLDVARGGCARSACRGRRSAHRRAAARRAAAATGTASDRPSGCSGAAARTRRSERAEKLMTRTGEVCPAGGGRSRPNRSSRSQQPLLHLAGPAGRVLGLDGQLHPAAASATSSSSRPRVSTELTRGPRPVRALLAVLPGAEVQRGQVRELQGGHGAAAVGGAVHSPVVHAHQLAVGGEPHVAFQGVRAVLDRPPVRGERVLGGVLGGASVGDHLDAGGVWGVRAVLPCLGHRVIVPPAGHRWRTNTQLLLTVA